MARLTGKVALITGAAGGQGTADAELFVCEEAAVVVTDIDIAAGEGLARRLTAQGGNVLFLRQDAADEASWQGSSPRRWRASASSTFWSTMPVRSRARVSSTRRSRRGTARSRSI